MNYIGARRDRNRWPGVIDQKNYAFNRAHGYPFVIDTYSTNYPVYLIDSNDGTFWTSASWMASKPWCALDLYYPRPIAKLRILQGSTEIATQFKISVKDDYLGSWIDVHTTPAGLTGGEYLWYPPLLTYRFWMATVVAASWVYGWNVYAFELWGPAGVR